MNRGGCTGEAPGVIRRATVGNLKPPPATEPSRLINREITRYAGLRRFFVRPGAVGRVNVDVSRRLLFGMHVR